MDSVCEGFELVLVEAVRVVQVRVEPGTALVEGRVEQADVEQAILSPALDPFVGNPVSPCHSLLETTGKAERQSRWRSRTPLKRFDVPYRVVYYRTLLMRKIDLAHGPRGD